MSSSDRIIAGLEPRPEWWPLCDQCNHPAHGGMTCNRARWLAAGQPSRQLGYTVEYFVPATADRTEVVIGRDIAPPANSPMGRHFTRLHEESQLAAAIAADFDR